ncbi:MAG: alpha/beta hydrolase [Planctomycetes bacterium]|nr:alpha/beta hydrolase [Planctomycetota bacterium]
MRIEPTRRSPLPTLTLLPLLALLALLATGCSSLERELSRQFLLPRRDVVARPDETGLACEEVWFNGADGTRRHALFLPHPDARGRTVLLCHGSAANLTYYFPYWELLHAASLNVLVWDYAGYGQSEGEALVSTLLPDARRALDWLVARPEVDARKIGALGISLGAIVALHLAAHDDRIACAAVEDAASPRENVDAALAREGRGAFSRWLGTTLVEWFALPDDCEPDANAARAAAAGKPLLLITGELEAAVDRTATERAFAATDGRAQLWVMAATGHAPHGLLQHAGRYEQDYARFFAAALDGAWRPDPTVLPSESPPTALRDLEPRRDALRGEFARRLAEAAAADATIDAALEAALSIAAWLAAEEARAPFPPPLEAELADLYVALAGEFARAAPRREDARRWQLRALHAVPLHPRRHWSAGPRAYRAGFPHGEAVASLARAVLAEERAGADAPLELAALAALDRLGADSAAAR